MSTKKLAVTKHAYKRAKERLGWKRKTLQRMAIRIYRCGYNIRETNGELYRFLQKKTTRIDSYTNVRIYGEFVYFFNNQALITMYRLSNRLLKHLAYMRA